MDPRILGFLLLPLIHSITIHGHNKEPVEFTFDFANESRITLNPEINLPPLFINFSHLEPPEESALRTQFAHQEDVVPISEFVNVPENQDPVLEHRRRFVINMTKSAWSAYSRFAWGHPELSPINRLNSTESANGKSIFAALTTLWVMGLIDEFNNGSAWIETEMNVTKIVQDQLWEVPGALLSLYALTGNGFFLQKARAIADKMDFPETNLWNYNKMWSRQRLEFRYLTDLTHSSKYWKHVQRVERILDSAENQFDNLQHSLGNSLMLQVKAHFQSNGVYKRALKPKYYQILEQLERTNYLYSSPESGLVMIRETPTRPVMSNWHCLFGAMLALGAEILPEVYRSKTNWNTLDAIRHLKLLGKAERHFDLARNLTDTCFLVANHTPSGLPFGQFKINEQVTRGERKFILGAGGYWLWPEMAESYFILYRMTRDRKYQDYAWELAQAIEKHAKVATSGGYAEVAKVDRVPVEKFRDSQPAKFLSGTLKYLFLTFAPDDYMPLSQWVFNAVGHPLPVCGRNQAYPKGICSGRSVAIV